MISTAAEYDIYRTRAHNASMDIAKALSKNKLDLNDGSYLMLEIAVMAAVKDGKDLDKLLSTVKGLYKMCLESKARGDI